MSVYVFVISIFSWFPRLSAVVTCLLEIPGGRSFRKNHGIQQSVTRILLLSSESSLLLNTADVGSTRLMSVLGIFSVPVIRFQDGLATFSSMLSSQVFHAQHQGCQVNPVCPSQQRLPHSVLLHSRIYICSPKASGM